MKNLFNLKLVISLRDDPLKFNLMRIFKSHQLEILARINLELILPVAEFKEFKRRFKFKPRFKYGWFHLKLYQMFPDLSQR